MAGGNNCSDTCTVLLGIIKQENSMQKHHASVVPIVLRTTCGICHFCKFYAASGRTIAYLTQITFAKTHTYVFIYF